MIQSDLVFKVLDFDVRSSKISSNQQPAASN